MRPSFRFSIGATFTVEPLEPVIIFWGTQLNLDFEVQFAPYNQVEQTLLDASGEFASNTQGVNAIAIRLEDLGGLDPERLRLNAEHFIEALRQAHPALGAPTILCLCRASADFLSDETRSRLARELEDRIAAAVAAMPGVHFLEPAQIEEQYPVADYEAAGGGQLGHIPYNELYYAALGTALVRRAHSLTRQPFKVITLDCDDTLWKGLCGEDTITLDEPRRALQEFMRRQREAGMLLTMASKNNEADMLETFASNPHMPLQLRDFTAWRINWESKAANLADLAQGLNLGLDSFIFVDDNPKECAEVESSVPEVLAVPLPSEVSKTAHFLRHLWAFDRGVVTEADRKRSESYTQTQQFGAGLRSASSLREFLAGLGLRVRIVRVEPGEVPRVAQLTQRTNQFNFTTIRRTEPAIQSLLEDGYDCLAVHVADRFGDYGLTGVVLMSECGGELVIDTFLLSCRVLGRGVEHRVMAHLAQYAAGRGLDTIAARLERTPRNTPAQQFLDSLGSADESHTYRLPAASLLDLEWNPEAAVTTAAPANRPAASPLDSPVDYVRIARMLSTPEQILAEMRRAKRSAMTISTADPPTTETERKLAEIWADLLHAPSISASDNFFDLGGHSLVAVLLQVRIQEAFGIELPIDDVYEGDLTLSELAQRIDMRMLGSPDSPEYAELLREIEALSDEEARDLLAEGGAGHANPADL